MTQQLIEDTTPTTLERFDYNYSPGGLPSNTYGYSRTDYSTPKTYLIAFDRLNRIKLEKMTESVYTRYQYEHTYDSAGNRTALTISGTWHAPRSFGYNYNSMGHMTTVTENVNLSNYVATVTTDANGNITEIVEVRNVLGTPTTVSIKSFEYEPPRPGQRCSQICKQHDGVRCGNEDSRLGKPCYVGIALERAIKERKSITQTLLMRPESALSSGTAWKSIVTNAGWKPALRRNACEF